MQSLIDKTVLITGAAGGFGQSMVWQFLREGCKIILSDLDEAKLRAATRETLDRHELPLGEAILGYIAADLSSSAGCDALYTMCQHITPSIDILVNNAGVSASGRLPDIPKERWHSVLHVNLIAPMELIAHVLPSMMQRRSGHIVNVASVASYVATPGLSAYCTSKFGLRGLSESLAIDVQPYGIDVTTIYPLFARTGILDSPQYGERPSGSIPDFLCYEPDFIISELLKSMKRRKRSVYPGWKTKTIILVQRLFPNVIPFLFARI
ncbi:MAG TPA: SDR family oxidoreductase [Gammaproteobacteria bacterium]|nr:SDR family oxidoreductase [Gammaproteobacteria bacterium]